MHATRVLTRRHLGQIILKVRKLTQQEIQQGITLTILNGTKKLSFECPLLLQSFAKKYAIRCQNMANLNFIHMGVYFVV